MKDNFVTAVSNELKGPLGSVLDLSRELQQQMKTIEQTQICEMIESSTEGLLVIVSDILDFQACQNNELKLHFSQFDLRTCLDECTQILRENPNVSLNLSVDSFISQTFIIESDRTRLKQVISNLLSNAMKFTEAGEVLFTVEVENAEEFTDNSCPKTVDIKFIVEDTVIGISSDQLKFLFQAFSQLDGSTTRKYAGTGLGLALSQRLVSALSEQQHEIQCQSTLGVGSTFSFVLSLPLLTFCTPTLPTDLISNKDDFELIVVSANTILQGILLIELKTCGFPPVIYPTIDKLSQVSLQNKKRIIVLDYDHSRYTNFNSVLAVDKTTAGCKFIILMQANKLQMVKYPKLQNCTIVFCPLTKKSLAVAITNLATTFN